MLFGGDLAIEKWRI